MTNTKYVVLYRLGEYEERRATRPMSEADAFALRNRLFDELGAASVELIEHEDVPKPQPPKRPRPPKLSTYFWGQRVEVFECGMWLPGTVAQAYRTDELCRVKVDGLPGILIVRRPANIHPLKPVAGKCPWCPASGDRLVVRGEMPTFTRYRCADCTAEFDVEKSDA